ncbi:hypothetical protein K502DRAFT_369027 [Neoconidiobolus thromboides FSU 785]|nr:hypothetical protein K502DRAFT_369027 [Neoconidiobolus thromboides FSU 785]
MTDIDSIIDQIQQVGTGSLNHFKRERVNDLLQHWDNYVIDNGLNYNQIDTIIDWILSNDIEHSIIRKVVILLIPNCRLDSEIVIKILSKLNYKMDLNNVLLLKWSLTIMNELNLIDNLFKLKKLYSLLFHYLNFDTIQDLMANYLYLLTEEHHVKPFRIRMLYELQNKYPLSSSIQSLLQCYKGYSPNSVILIKSNINKKGDFAQNNNQEWSNIVRKIIINQNQLKNISFSSELLNQNNQYFMNNSSMNQPQFKKQKIVNIYYDVKKVNIKNWKSIENIKFSNQLLWDTKMQIIAKLQQNEMSGYIIKFNWFINSILKEKIVYSNQYKKDLQLEEFLMNCCQFLQFFPNLYLPSILSFLTHYLLIWDGERYQSIIFQLIQLISSNIDYKDFYECILLPLMKLAQFNGDLFSIKLMYLFYNILNQWNLCYNELQFNKYLLFIDFVEQYYQIQYILVNNNSNGLNLAYLLFNNQVAKLNIKFNIPILKIPSNCIFSLCYFTNSLTEFNLILKYLINFKKSYELLNQSQSNTPVTTTLNTSTTMTTIDINTINQLNSIIILYCNSLYKFKGINLQHSILLKQNSIFELNFSLINELSLFIQNQFEDLNFNDCLPLANHLATMNLFLIFLKRKGIQLKKPLSLDWIKKDENKLYSQCFQQFLQTLPIVNEFLMYFLPNFNKK